MIIRLLIAQVIITILITASVVSLGLLHQVAGVLVGAAAMTGNLLALVWAWQRIFQKKSVAMAGAVIVFKYAILGTFIYLILVHRVVDAGGFTIGLSTVVPTMIWFAIEQSRNQNKMN